MKLVQSLVEKKQMIKFLSGDPQAVAASLPSLHVVDGML